VDAEVALHGEGCIAFAAGQVRVGLAGARDPVSGLAILGPFGHASLFGLAEVVAGGVLAEVDLDAAMLGRYASRGGLFDLGLVDFDGGVECIDFPARSPSHCLGRFLDQESP